MKAVEKAAEVEKKLLLWDPAGDDSVTIKQARGGEQERIEAYLGRFSMQFREDGVQQSFDWNQAEISFLRCWLTFVSSTLQEAYDEETEEKGVIKKEKKFRPMFPVDLKENEFRRKFNALPAVLRREWESKVLEVNPHWANLQEIADLEKN
jgi:hypothetical protein